MRTSLMACLIAISAYVCLNQNHNALGNARHAQQTYSVANQFVYLNTKSTRPLVEARIGDGRGVEQSGVFELDTGATHTTLNSSSTQKLGLKSGTTIVTKLTGRISTATAVLPVLRLGRVELKNLTVVVLEPMPSPYNVIGIIGADVLMGHVVTLDFPNERALFTSQPPTLSEYHVLLEEPIRIRDGLAFVSCRLPGIQQQGNCNLLLDTGFNEQVLFCTKMAKFLHLYDTETMILDTGNGESTAYFGTLSWIGIGGKFRIERAKVGVYDGGPPLPLRAKFCPGILGLAVLQRYVVQIDYGSRVLRLLQKN